MHTQHHAIFSLENFEGPLDFLLHLIQKSEIDIYEIAIQHITDQYLKQIHTKLAELNLDEGAEFIGLASSLLLLKSRMLLPKQERVEEGIEEIEADPRFEIIHQLIDYCRFKEAAKSLSEREEQQGIFFTRGCNEVGEPLKPLGIDHLSLDDLAQLFKAVLEKAKSHYGTIQEETWKVSDKIKIIRQLVNEMQELGFFVLFSPESCREELIVNFLAILELMKLGEICVVKENQNVFIRKYEQRN